MLTFDCYNPTSKTTSNAILGLLRKAFQKRYSIIYCCNHDPIDTRCKRTQKGAIEAELYRDGSGLEVAFYGWWLMLGVETKRGYWKLPCP